MLAQSEKCDRVYYFTIELQEINDLDSRIKFKKREFSPGIHLIYPYPYKTDKEKKKNCFYIILLNHGRSTRDDNRDLRFRRGF